MIPVLDGWCLVQYETAILSRVHWDGITLSALNGLARDAGRRVDDLLRTNQSEEAGAPEPEIAGGNNPGTAEFRGDADSDNGSDPADYSLAGSQLPDLDPNPWRGCDLAPRTFEALLQCYPADRVAANHVSVLEDLRRQIENERHHLSREVFSAILDSGRTRFLVVAKDLDFNCLPLEIAVPKAKQANPKASSPYQRNLFDITTEDDPNQFENSAATYLGQHTRLFSWCRNRARKDYYVWGSKPSPVYADLIVTLWGDEAGADDDLH